MTASVAAALSTASTRAASASDNRLRRIASDATSFHRAHGSEEFHRCAIAVCSGVRSRATRRTSSSAAWKVGDPYSGGGAGRNCDAESSNQVRAWVSAIPMGGTPGALYHLPAPVGIVPVQGAAKFTIGGEEAITR